ncbi:olfactory receptor 13C2-like [Trematomus bernacchii]|uniref:olfactory receptor 13C2-like n=1 Tax=Trematomus bernacchii TaxID=40690 RepID=UPI00146BF410|nr:olfactory receptor 13C2-like [Trematomus bernacchii]
MAGEYNVTYITLDGHVEVQRYRYLYFVIMFTVYVLIICSNSTIVCIIALHRNLHEPMYMFIAALLINSVLFSTNVYPKLLIDFLSEKQIISHSACHVQIFLYYSLSCSEFLLLAGMSYDRYVSICKPLQYPIIMRKITVTVCLVLSWVLPACHVAVPVAFSANTALCGSTSKGVFCNNLINKLHCVRSKAMTVFGVVVLINMSFLPVLFILYTYTQIFIIAYRSSAEVRRKAAQTCFPHLLVLINFSCLIIYDVVTDKLEDDFPKTVRLIMTLQMLLYHPLFNPIIYGLNMKEISKHLKRMFCSDSLNPNT